MGFHIPPSFFDYPGSSLQELEGLNQDSLVRMCLLKSEKNPLSKTDFFLSFVSFIFLSFS